MQWKDLSEEATEAVVEHETLVFDLEQARRELGEARERNVALRNELTSAAKRSATTLEDRDRVILLKTSIVTQLTEDFAALEMRSAEREESLQTQLSQAKAEAGAQIAALDAQVASLTLELGALHTYKEQKERVDREVVELRERAATDRREFDRRVHELRMQMVTDREQWDVQVRELEERTRAEMTASMQQQLDATTKRAIVENGRMLEELQYQGRQTARIEAENAALKALNGKLRRDAGLAQASVEEMAGRVRYLERVVGKLRDRGAAPPPARVEAVAAATAAAATAPVVLRRPPPDCECIVCDLCEARRSVASSLTAPPPQAQQRSRPRPGTTPPRRPAAARPAARSSPVAARPTTSARRSQRSQDTAMFEEWVLDPLDALDPLAPLAEGRVGSGSVSGSVAGSVASAGSADKHHPLLDLL